MADDDDDDLGVLPGADNLPNGVAVRLHKLASAKREARSRIAELEQQLSQLQEQHAAELAEREKQIEELAPLRDQVAELEAARSGWESEKVIVSAGITDPEGIEFARLAYSRIPEEERPKDGLSAWLAEDNRENLPRAVTAYFAEAGGAQQRAAHNPDSGVRPEGRSMAARGTGTTWADVRAERLAEHGIRPLDVSKLTGRG